MFPIFVCSMQSGRFCSCVYHSIGSGTKESHTIEIVAIKKHGHRKSLDGTKRKKVWLIIKKKWNIFFRISRKIRTSLVAREKSHQQKKVLQQENKLKSLLGNELILPIYFAYNLNPPIYANIITDLRFINTYVRYCTCEGLMAWVD